MPRFARGRGPGWLYALACAMLLTGCWDRVEVTDLALVVGMGVDDAADNGVEVTVQLLSPLSQQSGQSGTSMQGRGGQSSQRAYINYNERGKTLQEALDRLYRTIPRRVFVAHNTVIVFGRRYAEKGFDRALDYIERERNFRRSQIFVVTGGSARDLLDVSTGPERVNARGLRKLVDQQMRTTITEPSVELRVVNDLLSPSRAPIMAWVDPADNQPRIKGLGLFREGKLADLLPAQESRGLLWLLGRAGQTFIHIPCPGEKKQHRMDSLSVRLLSVNVDLEPIPTPTGLMFRIHAAGQGEVDAVCQGEKPTPEHMRQWGERVAQLMQTEMDRTLERLKAKRADAAQFGTRLFRKNPGMWRKIARHWPETFQSCRVEYDIRINLLRAGMISQTPLQGQTPENFPPHQGQGQE